MEVMKARMKRIVIRMVVMVVLEAPVMVLLEAPVPRERASSQEIA